MADDDTCPRDFFDLGMGMLLTVSVTSAHFAVLKGSLLSVRTTNRALYSRRRPLLALNDSSLRFLRRWSTAMPTERASFHGIPAAFSSSRVNPRPALTFTL